MKLKSRPVGFFPVFCHTSTEQNIRQSKTEKWNQVQATWIQVKQNHETFIWLQQQRWRRCVTAIFLILKPPAWKILNPYCHNGGVSQQQVCWDQLLRWQKVQNKMQGTRMCKCEVCMLLFVFEGNKFSERLRFWKRCGLQNQQNVGSASWNSTIVIILS